MSTAYNTFASWDAVKHHAFNHTIEFYGKAKSNEDDYSHLFSAIGQDLREKRSVTHCGIAIHMPHSDEDYFLAQRYKTAPSPEAKEYGVQFRKHVADGIWDAYRFLSDKRKSFKRSDWIANSEPGYVALASGYLSKDLEDNEHGELFKKHLASLRFTKNEYDVWEGAFDLCDNAFVHEDTLQDAIIKAADEFDAHINRFVRDMKEEAANGHDSFEEHARDLYWGKPLPKDVVDSLIAAFFMDGMPEEKVYAVWKEENEQGKIKICFEQIVDSTFEGIAMAIGSHNYVEPVWKKLKAIDGLRLQRAYKRNKINELNESILKEEREITELKEKREAMNKELRNLIEKS